MGARQPLGRGHGHVQALSFVALRVTLCHHLIKHKVVYVADVGWVDDRFPRDNVALFRGSEVKGLAVVCGRFGLDLQKVCVCVCAGGWASVRLF